MLRTFRWTLLAFMALASLPAPSRGDDGAFRFDLQIHPKKAEIDTPRIIRVRFHNNSQTRKLKFYIWHARDRRAMLLNEDPTDTSVTFRPPRPGQYIVKVQVSDRRHGWLVKQGVVSVAPKDGLFRMALHATNEVGYFRDPLRLSVRANKSLRRRRITFMYFDQGGNGWRKIPNESNAAEVKWRPPRPGHYILRVDVSSTGEGYHSEKIEFEALSRADYLQRPRIGRVRMTGHARKPELPFPPFLPDLPPPPPKMVGIDKEDGEVWQQRKLTHRLKYRNLDPDKGRVTVLVRHERDDRWTIVADNLYWLARYKLWTPHKAGKWKVRLDVIDAEGRETRYIEQFRIKR
jgi:hypothetical protein